MFDLVKVLGISHSEFDDKLETMKSIKGINLDTELTASDLKELVEKYKDVYVQVKGKKFPSGTPSHVHVHVFLRSSYTISMWCLAFYYVLFFLPLLCRSEDPKTQLELAIKAVFDSWDSPRAIKYRSINHITGLKGTAVNIQCMVFGNMGNTSGTGVLFTRNPNTGEKKLYGEFLTNAQVLNCLYNSLF